MRVAIDLTNSPHVPFFVPLVRRLEAAGHTVTVTARQFAQTVELAASHGLDAHVVGQHGGGSRSGKARAAFARTTGLLSYLRREHRAHRFDVALSHGSTDLPLVSRALGIPHVTMFDYEWARTMHRLNCRLSWRVMTPDAIPPERLFQYGAAAKLVQYPGLKEEYYLHDVDLDPSARAWFDASDHDILAVLRPPPELALYHRGAQSDLFEAVTRRLLEEGAIVVALARTPEQRVAIANRFAGIGRLHTPERAVDAHSLIAASDLVVSAGGTMNREAVALGTPVYTVFAGRMGGVDEQLVAEGRLRLLERADDVAVQRSTAADNGVRASTTREPQQLLDLALHGLPVSTPVS